MLLVPTPLPVFPAHTSDCAFDGHNTACAR